MPLWARLVGLALAGAMIAFAILVLAKDEDA